MPILQTAVDFLSISPETFFSQDFAHDPKAWIMLCAFGAFAMAVKAATPVIVPALERAWKSLETSDAE